MTDFFCARCAQIFTVTVNGWGLPNCPQCNQRAQNVTADIRRNIRAYQQARDNNRHNQGVIFHEDNIAQRMISALDERGLALVSLVCRKYHQFAQPLLQAIVPGVLGYGSLSSYGGKFSTLKHQLIAPDSGILHNVTRLRLAVDQFPLPSHHGYDSSVLKYILSKNINIELSLGTASPGVQKALAKAGRDTHLIENFAKMHNKIWVLDYDGVIVGSPNISVSGLEGANIESFILIKSARVGALFARYLRYLQLRGSNHPSVKDMRNRQLALDTERDAVEKELGIINSAQHHSLRIALAPIMSITDFVVDQLQDATSIIIRQFLISQPYERDRYSTDIVGVLCEMALQKVEIEVYLDEAAYLKDEHKCLQPAADRLMEAGVKVYTQKPVIIVDTSHESIMHDKLILAKLSTGVCRTLIGTAGFTGNVIANRNAETFISTDVENVYTCLMRHHLNSKREIKAITRPLNQ